MGGKCDGLGWDWIKTPGRCCGSDSLSVAYGTRIVYDCGHFLGIIGKIRKYGCRLILKM